MSVIKEILENIAEYLDNHPNFQDYHGLQYYYDEWTVNANTELPFILFKVGFNDDNSELGIPINKDCRDYYRSVQIRLYTLTNERDVLMDELWEYEEALQRCLNTAYSPSNIHPNLEDIKYSGTKPLVEVYKQAFRDDYEGEWFCNMCTVEFELKYTI